MVAVEAKWLFSLLVKQFKGQSKRIQTHLVSWEYTCSKKALQFETKIWGEKFENWSKHENCLYYTNFCAVIISTTHNVFTAHLSLSDKNWHTLFYYREISYMATVFYGLIEKQRQILLIPSFVIAFSAISSLTNEIIYVLPSDPKAMLF
jgi:hypothetical protein